MAGAVLSAVEQQQQQQQQQHQQRGKDEVSLMLRLAKLHEEMHHTLSDIRSSKGGGSKGGCTNNTQIDLALENILEGGACGSTTSNGLGGGRARTTTLLQAAVSIAPNCAECHVEMARHQMTVAKSQEHMHTSEGTSEGTYMFNTEGAYMFNAVKHLERAIAIVPDPQYHPAYKELAEVDQAVGYVYCAWICVLCLDMCTVLEWSRL
jgi:hypothetical protein